MPSDLTACHAGVGGRDCRLLLPNDDRSRGRRFGSTRATQRHGTGGRRARRPRDPGAVLRVDADGARRLRHGRRRRQEILARLAWEIGGAVAFGVLIGVLFALYLRYIGREITLVLLAVCAVLSQVGTTQQLQPLLAALAAGVVIENLAVAQGDTLRAAVRRGAPPVLVVFFVAVGASLRLDAVAAIGISAVALSAVRLGFIRLGVAAGVKSSGLPESIGKYAWTGLVSQAGITLGFASVVAAEFPGWGNQVQLLLVVIAIHELVGPVLFRRGLAGRVNSTCTRFAR